MSQRIVYATALLAFTACGSDPSDTAKAMSDVDQAWAAYEIAPPSAETDTWLNGTPFLFAEEVCVPTSEIEGLDSGALRTTLDDGTEAVCFQDAFNGNVPEGLAFTDLSTCERAWTQGPPWFAAPQRKFTSDDRLLEDADYVTELAWVRDQVATSGCACCHASGVGSGHTSGFDIDAPGVWTDSMTNAQLAMAAGLFPEHSLFGHFEAELNHGFDRQTTLFASTDPARMAAFFDAELDRRGGTDADLEEAQGQFDALFGRLFLPVDDCIVPYEGLVDGVVTWNSSVPVRQIYVLEPGSPTPAFPPNLDLPEDTVWAVYVDPSAAPLEPGTVTLGTPPSGTTQVAPLEGPPALESGRTYRLYATPDIMIPAQLDCTFVAP